MKREEYMKGIIPAMEVVIRKHEDYNQGVALDDYFPFGDFSYVQMLYVKVLRLRSLIENGRTPNHESVADTVDDLINYAVFYRLYLMGVDDASRV